MIRSWKAVDRARFCPSPRGCVEDAMQLKSRRRTARVSAVSGSELALAAAVPRILAAPAQRLPALSDDRAALDLDPIFEAVVTVDSLADASSAVEWSLIAIERREIGSLSSEYPLRDRTRGAMAWRTKRIRRQSVSWPRRPAWLHLRRR